MADIKAIEGINGITYDLRDDYSVWGGNNLLEYSDVYCYSTGQNAYFDKTLYRSKGIVTYNRTAVKNEGFYVTNTTKYELNTPYIIHFDIQETGSTKVINHFFIYCNGTAMGIQPANTAVWVDGEYKNTFDQTINTNILDGNIHHIDCCFIPTAASTSTYKGIIFQALKNTASAFNIAVSNLKWEKGHKATDWSPNYKDIFVYDSTNSQLIVNL